MLSEAQKKGNKKYLSKFDDIKIRIPSGQREQIKKYAEEKGKSLNQFIVDLIKEDMSKSGKELK